MISVGKTWESKAHCGGQEDVINETGLGIIKKKKKKDDLRNLQFISLLLALHCLSDCSRCFFFLNFTAALLGRHYLACLRPGLQRSQNWTRPVLFSTAHVVWAPFGLC